MKKKKARVGFYGERGSFSEEGALSCIENSWLRAYEVELIPCGKEISTVFSKVLNNEADFGVVPVENSSAGIIVASYDLLLGEKIFIVGEGINRIEQHLMANKGVTLDQVKHIYSHTAALYQCRNFFRSGNWEKHPAGDTTSGVRKIKVEKLTNAAAIAGKQAAEFYEMEILQKNLEDNVDNFTRFFVISKDFYQAEKANKTSIAIELRNGLNSLASYLELFVENDIELLNIQSRPIRDKIFEYVVYLDFGGALNDEKIKAILPDLLHETGEFRFLGSYRKATLNI